MYFIKAKLNRNAFIYNSLPTGGNAEEGALVYGGLGAATAIALFTLAHAVVFAGNTPRRLDIQR